MFERTFFVVQVIKQVMGSDMIVVEDDGGWQEGRKTHWGLKNQYRIVKPGVVEMKLTQNKTTTFNLDMLEQVKQYTWFVHQSKNTWYAETSIVQPDGTKTLLALHRLVMPGVVMVDHINGDGLNNLRSNLRDGSNGVNQNNQKLRCDNKTGESGISMWTDRHSITYWRVSWYDTNADGTRSRKYKSFSFAPDTKNVKLQEATEFRNAKFAEIGNNNGTRR